MKTASPRSLAPLVLFGLAVAGCSESPWSPSSSHLSLSASGYFDGSLSIEVDTPDLTPEQLRLAASLSTESSGGECSQDIEHIVVRITDRKGTTSTFDANPEDCESAHELVTYSVARALIASFGCKSASATSKEHHTRADAASIVPSKACHHGVFASYAADELWIALDVAAAGRYRVETEECRGLGVQVAVFERDGTTPLAVAEPAGACAVLEQDLPAAGRYLIRLTKGTTTDAGDYGLRVTGPR